MFLLSWKRGHLTAKQKVSAYNEIWIVIYDSANFLLGSVMKWSYNYYLCSCLWHASIQKKITKIPFELLQHSQSEDTLLWCAIWEWFPHEMHQITDSHVATFFLRFLRLLKHFTAVRFVWNCPGFSKGTL